MIDSKCFYKEYLRNKPENTMEFHDNLVKILQLISSRKKDSHLSLFDADTSRQIFSPDDQCREAYSRAEVLGRAIYTFLSLNKLHDAAACLLYLVKNYCANLCFVWRVGFHIIPQISTKEELHNFFKIMVEMRVPDRRDMIYEYLQHLMMYRDFAGVRSAYLFSYHQTKPSRRRGSQDHSQVLVRVRIHLTVALACYAIWKESLRSAVDELAGDDAEVHFQYIRDLIDADEVVDDYLVCYVDLLEQRGKLQEAFKVLKMDYYNCGGSLNGGRHLLRFLVKNEGRIPEVSPEFLPSVRLHFLEKVVSMRPVGEVFAEALDLGCCEQEGGHSDHEGRGESSRIPEGSD